VRTSEAATTYDALPYESYAFALTHPDRLATVARLHGLAAPPMESCRVLELGCAGGGNLLPMAVSLPQSQFVGIDLSRRQIADGQKLVKDLGLTNVELHSLSILDIDNQFGTFDYIICHGVYSWVPPPVQDKILEIAASNLSAAGVAYVSYNTYPGWQIRHMIRDILLYHARRFDDPRAQVREARWLVEFLARTIPDQADRVYPKIVKAAAQVFRSQSDTYLLHEYLEEVNEPLYFHEFVARVQAKGLQYLADARLASVASAPLPAEAAEALQRLAGDFVQREQYRDFLESQAFRRSLLCGPGHELSPAPRPEFVANLYAASSTQPLSARPELASNARESFRTAEGFAFSVTDPLLKAALCQLGDAWPLAVPVAALPGADGRLQTDLLTGYLACLINFHAGPSRFVRDIHARPVASPLARLQARAGPRVTNLRHEVVELAEIDRCVIGLLDGSRDRTALTDSLVDLVSKAVVTPAQLGLPSADMPAMRTVAVQALEPSLLRICRLGLLMG
jgi:hypothetical protein